jgi:hypothetical protein
MKLFLTSLFFLLAVVLGVDAGSASTEKERNRRASFRGSRTATAGVRNAKSLLLEKRQVIQNVGRRLRRNLAGMDTVASFERARGDEIVADADEVEAASKSEGECLCGCLEDPFVVNNIGSCDYICDFLCTKTEEAEETSKDINYGSNNYASNYAEGYGNYGSHGNYASNYGDSNYANYGNYASNYGDSNYAAGYGSYASNYGDYNYASYGGSNYYGNYNSNYGNYYGNNYYNYAGRRNLQGAGGGEYQHAGRRHKK